MKSKHNKIRNTGILFELLVRKIAMDVLNGKSDSFAIKVMQEHFHPKSELGKELQLYRTFFNMPKLSEGKALDMIDIIVARRKTLNESVLSSQKYALIRTIKEQCDLKDFMNGRVPSYKVYASVYKLFETDISAVLVEDLVKSRYLIAEHLQNKWTEEPLVKESSFAAAVKNQDEEIRHLSYKFLLEKFNFKYSGLSTKQKALLREYINKGTDVEPFKHYVAQEANILRTSLTTLTKRVNNEVTRIKLHEVIAQLTEIYQRPTIKENHVTALMIAYQLADEITTITRGAV
jgi:hypothetical protein